MFYSERYNFLYIEAKQYPQNSTSRSKVSAKSLLICSCLATALIASCHAQADQPEQNTQNIRWSGQASAGTNFNSGNTNTFDLNANINLKGETGPWTLTPQIRSEIGRNANTETRNRQYFSMTIGRKVQDRLDVSVSADYTLDRFSGYDYRSFVGLGLTYDAIIDEKLTFTIGAFPGIRFDRTTESIVSDMTIPSIATTALGAQLNGNFTWKLSETVNVTWNGKADNVATTPGNITFESNLATNIRLIGSLEARLLLNHRYVTDPPVGRVNLDTRISVALVYQFG